MRGRKPHSTRRRALDGNPGRRPLNLSEPSLPDPVADAFDVPPPELTGHPAAAAEWQRVAPMLRAARVVTEGDRQALVALCVEWAHYVEAQRQVAARGLVVLTPQGVPIPNPYLLIATTALKACQRIWTEFGLTPSSRTRLHVPEAPPVDPFAEFDLPLPVGAPLTPN